MTIYRGQTYLQKHRFRPRQISTPPPANLHMVVVIPCHDEPDLLATLDSLEACIAPRKKVEVIIVVNAGAHHSTEIKAANEASRTQFEQWNAQARRHSYHLIWQPDLPKKHAGVGLARKIGMDEAIDRLEQVAVDEGIVIGLDADTTVEPTYLVEIERWFRDNPKMDACSLGFAHPLKGKNYEPAVYNGIVLYELYLRYYVQGLRYAGFPLAYHCIGSAMAVRAKAYAQQNGMNRRKAGEDYYFLHKYMLLGKLGELRKVIVLPSPRPSHKVPFGTGRAILNWLEGDQIAYPAFDVKGFEILRELVKAAPSFWKSEKQALPEPVEAFLTERGFFESLPEMQQHAKSEAAFLKRFYRWFDGLKALQFMHYLRDSHLPDQDILVSAENLLKRVGRDTGEDKDAKQLLALYRVWEQEE